jgi:UDP-N-acetylglucosamine--N-acetylmuramyl-(pentapeptide) pyrophosphoryl-undecaprenol N-acetylglucosamine transferase
MEMQKVPEAGYDIEGLWISGIRRKLTLDNIAFPIKLISSLIKSGSILSRFKPDAVVGVGGFASGPLLYMAANRKLPSLIQEQNSYAGLTNKLLGKKADAICVAHDGMERYFPGERIKFTGNPVRQDITDLDQKQDSAIQFFKLDHERKTILVIGGSLGARSLNESILSGLEKLIEKRVQLIWQTGDLYFQEFLERAKGLDLVDIRMLRFLKEMDFAYAAADIVLSRAGALSISELAIARKPVIFVPSPNVAEDHQTRNAQSLVEKNAALLVPDSEARHRLVTEALRLLANTDKQAELSENIGKLARPHAARDIAHEIIKIIQ